VCCALIVGTRFQLGDVSVWCEVCVGADAGDISVVTVFRGPSQMSAMCEPHVTTSLLLSDITNGYRFIEDTVYPSFLSKKLKSEH